MTDADPTPEPQATESEPPCPCGRPKDDPVHEDPYELLDLEPGSPIPDEFADNHPYGWSGADPMMAELQEQYNALFKENNKRERALGRGNPPMGLDDASKAAMRFETILNVIMPPGTLDRLRFEFFYQQTISEALDNAFAEQRRISLQVDPRRASGGGLILGGKG